jgi:Zn-dependent protease with chaperone function
MLKGIFIALFCNVLLFLIHFIILSLLKKERRYPSPVHQLLDITRLLIKTCANLLVVYTLLFFLIPDDFFSNLTINYLGSLKIFSFFYGVFLYVCLFFLYLIFYFIVDRSVSATIMIEIESSPDKRLTSEQIEKIYNIDKKYLAELEGMLQGRFITEIAGYFSNTAKGRLYAHLAKFLKKYFKLGPGG